MNNLKEIGELLKDTREKNGVSIEEASGDLNYKVSQLECKVTELYGLLINDNDFIQTEYLIPIKK